MVTLVTSRLFSSLGKCNSYSFSIGVEKIWPLYLYLKQVMWKFLFHSWRTPSHFSSGYLRKPKELVVYVGMQG